MGSGFSLDAIKVVRLNRSLLKRRKFKDIKDLVIETSGKTELEFRKISPSELEFIKAKIREKAKKEADRELTIYGVCLIILILFGGFLFISNS